MKRAQKTGLVIGKFMPLHQGHELLFDFASHFVDHLFIVIDNVPPERYKKEFIPGKIRVNWVKKTCQQAQVLYLPKVTPQEPSDHPNFWNIWKKNLLNLLPSKPDYVFASEEYGFPLSNILKTTFIPVDIERRVVNIRGTNIRVDLLKNWELLAPAVKPDFILRICVGGPESAGKSTLVHNLAKHFKTIFVPEYARTFLEEHMKSAKKQGQEYKINFEDMTKIARGQLALEELLAHRAKKVLFCDTDVLTTTIWSRLLFAGKCSREVLELAEARKYDLYLLAKPDIGWEKDEVRYTPTLEEREKFFAEQERLLKLNNYNYIIIDGNYKKREARAIQAVEKLIKENFNYPYFAQKLQK